MGLNKTVLAFHAHPDDTELFAGGTLALLKEKGFKIVSATTTNGGIGGVLDNEEDTARIRKSEAANAVNKLDGEYYCLDERDGFLFDTESTRMKAVELIRKVKPDIVITHLLFDYHTDHRTTSSIVEFATLVATLPNIKTESAPLKATPLLYHSVPYNLEDPLGRPVAEPSFYLDISTTVKLKQEMSSCHESQKKLLKLMFQNDNFIEVSDDFDRKIGELAGSTYAEAFWQHLGGGFQKDPLLQDTLREYVKCDRDKK